MSDKKTLTVNPDLFSFSNNTTRKKRSKSDPGSIKMKATQPKKKNDTLKKKSILKMIRQHQEDRYKKLFEGDKTKPNNSTLSQPGTQIFNKEFQEAKLFLENLTEKKQHETQIKNHTLKHYPNPTPNSLLLAPSTNVFAQPLQSMTNITQNTPPSRTMHINTGAPKYGCLKNGALPTYRNFMNQTRKNVSDPVIHIGGSNLASNQAQSISTLQQAAQSLTIGGAKSEAVEQRINESINRVKQMNQTALKLQELKKQMRPKKMKRKKTKRRTYKIGKSKVLPKVSVLVSNKTIRNNISTKKQLLKQVPLQDIKSYLMKRGFIKVGSTAPSDVLRKMYESAAMICGEVQNHNPDNLLYNYLNGGDT
jgi:hypothetical protein